MLPHIDVDIGIGIDTGIDIGIDIGMGIGMDICTIPFLLSLIHLYSQASADRSVIASRSALVVVLIADRGADRG